MAVPSLERMARWARNLTLDQVPPRVVEEAKNQVLSTLAATHAGYASDLGPKITRAFRPTKGAERAIPHPYAMPAAQAAFLMSAWSMVLDFDDSMLGGHTGHATALVPVAYARDHSGADLLCAQIAANEIAARVNTAVALGPLRGQMATHVHLLGASVARGKLDGLEADDLASAAGFALTYPAKALYPGFLGSDAKVLAAAWPVRMGLDAVDAVRAGLRGNPGILDGRRGFLSSSADVPLPGFLGGLGTRWHTETNSYKIYPGCAYLDAVIDATLAIVRRYEVVPDHVERIDVDASIFTVGMDARSAPYVKGPDSPLSALSFSTPYNVACAIRDRELAPRHLTGRYVADTDLWELAGKVRIHHDEDLTIAALTSDAPMGAALKLAGRDALRYVRRMTGGSSRRLPRPGDVRRTARGLRSGARIVREVLREAGPVPEDLTAAEKAIGARVTIRTTDGRMFTESTRIPRGATGWGDAAAVRDLMREKYLACAAEVLDEGTAKESSAMLERLEELSADEVRDAIELNLRKKRSG